MRCQADPELERQLRREVADYNAQVRSYKGDLDMLNMERDNAVPQVRRAEGAPNPKTINAQ